MLSELNKLKLLWSVKSDHNFNDVAYGKLFNYEENVIAIGTEDGSVKVYTLNHPQGDSNDSTSLKLYSTLEAKCGSIFQMSVNNISQLNSHELVVADNKGRYIVFFEGQILKGSSHMTSKFDEATALTVHKNILNEVKIYLGKKKGEIICFNTFTEHWKLNIDSFDPARHHCVPAVTHLLCTSFVHSKCSLKLDYLLASDSNGKVHVIKNGVLSKTVNVGHVVNTMCKGNFLHLDNIDEENKPTQIALGCNDGYIFIMVDFQVITEVYAKISHPITHLSVVHNTSHVDSIICCGHFTQVKVFKSGVEKASFGLPSWPVTVKSLAENSQSLSRFEKNKILVGCMDKTVILLQVS